MKWKRKTLQKMSRPVAAFMLAAMLAAPTAAMAADVEASISSKAVSQQINGSNEYVYDGNKTDPTLPSLVVHKPSTGQWGYVNNGRVQVVNGLYSNWHGFWLIKNGWVDFNANGIIHATDRASDDWYSFSGGKRVFTDNQTIMNNSNGWWYLQDGEVNFNYTGFARNFNGVWYVKNGQVDFNLEDVIKDEAGVVDGTVSWYHVKDGQVDLNETDIAKNANGWWKITNGKVDFNYTGVAKNDNGYWLLQNGKVNFSANGWYEGFYFSGGKAVTRP